MSPAVLNEGRIITLWKMTWLVRELSTVRVMPLLCDASEGEALGGLISGSVHPSLHEYVCASWSSLLQAKVRNESNRTVWSSVSTAAATPTAALHNFLA